MRSASTALSGGKTVSQRRALIAAASSRMGSGISRISSPVGPDRMSDHSNAGKHEGPTCNHANGAIDNFSRFRNEISARNVAPDANKTSYKWSKAAQTQANKGQGSACL